MAAFDDSTDATLGAACNRLAAWVELMPAGIVVDPASMLSEEDLALILRHLHATRHVVQSAGRVDCQPRRASVPLTVRD